MVVEDRPVVFLHVMKCGGSSVRAALANGIAGSRRGAGVFEYDGRTANAVIPSRAGESLAALGERRVQFADALLPYVLLTDRPKVVLGHFRYHDHFTALLEGRANFVTVLREPVERLVSLYRYRRFKAGVELPVDVPLPELIASGRWDHLGHTYVDTFKGDDALDASTPAALDAAMRNLDRFATVGFTDDLDGSRGVRLVARRQGDRDPASQPEPRPPRPPRCRDRDRHARRARRAVRGGSVSLPTGAGTSWMRRSRHRASCAGSRDASPETARDQGSLSLPVVWRSAALPEPGARDPGPVRAPWQPVDRRAGQRARVPAPQDLRAGSPWSLPPVPQVPPRIRGSRSTTSLPTPRPRDGASPAVCASSVAPDRRFATKISWI